MADRAISDLTQATSMTDADLFAISQGGQAKKVTWETFYTYLAEALDGHGGIKNISYTSPSSGSLNGTLTITLGDDTEESFTITNGRGITSISKTGTSGLEDTYTISYNNNTTSTFKVKNGRGITNFSKSTSGLVDTYTISYNDGTTSEIVVTNGRAISSITTYYAGSDSNTTVPTSWSETPQTMTTVNKYLWSYQTITFNDSTTLDTTKSVVGAYGDTGATGQAWYVHIKYSEEEPTADSDMKDSPDAWIGVYSGTAESAPTTYTSYEWYEYKGQTGDTGAAATLVTQDVSYQWGDSGTTAPSGTWSSTVPVKPSSDTFLWTKVDLEFNSGSPMTFYSVSHYGVDGTGAVNTVNEISPDGNGNVTVDAEDIVFAADRTKDVESSILTAESNIGGLQTIAGDGSLSGFTATDLTGAANELKASVNTTGGALANKRVLLIGDSISNPDYDTDPSWSNYFETMLSQVGSTLTTVAANGRGYAYAADGYNFLTIMQTLTLTDYDVIIVFGGINDFYDPHGISLGQLNQNTAGRFCTNVNAVNALIKASGALGVIVSPIPTKNTRADMLSLGFFGKAVCAAAKRDGLLFIDGGSFPFLPADGSGLIDNTHPVSAVREPMARHIFDSILSGGDNTYTSLDLIYAPGLTEVDPDSTGTASYALRMFFNGDSLYISLIGNVLTAGVVRINFPAFNIFLKDGFQGLVGTTPVNMQFNPPGTNGYQYSQFVINGPQGVTGPFNVLREVQSLSFQAFKTVQYS